MSIPDILQNLDRRLGALETDDIDETSTLVQIRKIYADFEIDVKLTWRKHQYHICGEFTESAALLGVYDRRMITCGPGLLL